MQTRIMEFLTIIKINLKTRILFIRIRSPTLSVLKNIDIEDYLNGGGHTLPTSIKAGGDVIINLSKFLILKI